MSALANSPLEGNLHGKKAERAFRDLLGSAGIVNLREDTTISVGRKWRAAMSQLGFIYPDLSRTSLGKLQSDLGPVDAISPNGQNLIETSANIPAMQECFLRAISAYAIPSPIEKDYSGKSFSPLSMVLAILFELEKLNEASELSFLEIAVIIQLTSGNDKPHSVANKILKFRQNRRKAKSSREFARKAYKEAANKHGYIEQTFRDYADTNIRYMKATGLVQAKASGIELTPAKKHLSKELSKDIYSSPKGIEYLKRLCKGRALPIDNLFNAKLELQNMVVNLRQYQINYNPPVSNDIREIKLAMYKCEALLFEAKETEYAKSQKEYWQEISDYMNALVKKTRRYANVTVPFYEAPAYFEWILWRAFLAINTNLNQPYQARRFKVGTDFLPISTAPGGGPDMVFEFKDFVVAVEVTLTEGSRQEAVEGEPVRRHVADIAMSYAKPVFGLFVASQIDINTLETFRHGIWYYSKEQSSRLKILPISLDLFAHFFKALFQKDCDRPKTIKRLLMNACDHKLRDRDNAPAWEQQIQLLTKSLIENQ